MNAALILRPAVVAQVHHADAAEASRRAASVIEHALGCERVVQADVGDGRSADAVRREVMRLAEMLRTRHRCSRCIVHVTGSTKILAIGAYEAARQMGLDCVYLELPRDDADGVPQLLSLETGELDATALTALMSDPSARMSLELVAEAHGYPLTVPGEDFAPFVEFARLALEDDDSEDQLQHSLPAAGGDRAPWPEEPLWRAWREEFFLPAVFRDAAVAAKIVEESGSRVRIAEPGAGAPRELRRKIFERNASLLRGAWLEVALADAMAASARLQDVRWSVEAESPRPMEHDVLAMKGTTLVVASAKRSIQRGIFGHLRELKAHAHRLGGMKGIPLLAIARTDRRRMSIERASVADDLVEVCESLGVLLCTRAQLIRRDLSGLGLGQEGG